MVWKPSLLVRDGFQCIYCGLPFNADRPDRHTLDHLIPRCYGGPDRMWNLAIACVTCNGRKFTKPWPAALDKLTANLRSLLNETRAAIEAC